MLKKKRSLVTYTIIMCGLIMTVGIACLLFIQNSIVKDDMELQAYEKLSQETRQVRRFLNYDKSHTPSIGREYYDRDDDMENNDKLYVFLQSANGDHIAGEVPDGYNEKLSYQSDLDIKSFNGVKYYILTRKAKVGLKTIENDNFMICAMVSVKDIKANYRILWYRTYTVIGVVALFFCVFAIGLRRLVAVPMKELNVAINRSGQNLDFTEKLRYDGPFLELDMITESNNNLYDRVQREFERQEEFNANVSHELRTPVAVMHAQCQLSREIAEKNNDYEMLESIAVFERQTTRMKGLIEQLLQMSILEKNKINLSVEDVDLLDVVESVCDDAEYICKKNIQFSYDLVPTVVKVNMNLIVIVVSNLVSNAIKYSNEGGVVEVTCGSDSDTCYISVRDEGRGISKEQKNRIFESFYRADTVRNTEGFGLGLSQVMKIAKYYGGTVQVDSEVGKGSKFTFIIPVDNG